MLHSEKELELRREIAMLKQELRDTREHLDLIVQIHIKLVKGIQLWIWSRIPSEESDDKVSNIGEEACEEISDDE